METIHSVGLREFRANLHKYTSANMQPVTVTSHDRVVGYFIPARPAPTREDFESLKAVNRTISAILDEAGIEEDEIVAEFDALRKAGRKQHNDEL